MKKLLLLLAVLLTVGTAQAQEYKAEFHRDYDSGILYESDDTTEGWMDYDVRVIFNYGGVSNKVKMFVGDLVSTLTQTEGTTEGATSGGITYFALPLQDDETGEELLMQVFKDERYGIRLIDKTGVSLQFSNKQ